LRRGHCSWNELILLLETLDFEKFRENVAEISRPERTALILAGEVKEGATRNIW
jgi:hypothetical protein